MISLKLATITFFNPCLLKIYDKLLILSGNIHTANTRNIKKGNNGIIKKSTRTADYSKGKDNKTDVTYTVKMKTQGKGRPQ